MRVDIGNALATEASPGVPRSALERLDDRVGAVHERLESGRRAAVEARESGGDLPGAATGYAAFALPETAAVDRVEAVADDYREHGTLLVVGIGGSALGAATLVDALETDRNVVVLDNVDPDQVAGLLDALDLTDVAVNVVSRSGGTVETLANFLVVRDALADAGVGWTERTVVTTGASGPLRELADAHDLPALDVPPGVPGRFSALSTVGLFPAAFAGVDARSVLAGGGAAVEALGPDLFDAPAYAYGATCHALEERDASVLAMMPYAESLETFAEWFAQLWAESLGKDGLGQTPARAVGATDQHSQLQLYRDGPRDKLVTLLDVTERADVPVPSSDDLPVGGRDLGAILTAEFRATEASLAESGVPNVRLTVPTVDAFALGDLLVSMEAACVLAGDLAGVDPFTQPAVEWGKRAARQLLAGESLPAKRELVVE